MTVTVKKVKVAGAKALLINEAVKIKKREKRDKERLAEIKEELGYKSAGTYITNQGGILCINSKDGRAIIPPIDILNELKKQRKSKMFPTCVSVIIKNTESIIGKDKIDALKKKYAGKSILSWSFK